MIIMVIIIIVIKKIDEKSKVVKSFITKGSLPVTEWIK